MIILRITLCFFLFFLINSCSPQPDETPIQTWTAEDREFLIKNLEESRESLLKEIEDLTEYQWNYRIDEDTWSVGLIVEHLGLQEVMHYREVYVLSLAPAQPNDAGKTRQNDPLVLAYETSPEKGIADWLVEPLGRWCNKISAIDEFNRNRNKMVEFVSNTDIDLRTHFTFRNIRDETDFRRVRDLHQIILTTIAHTKRHLHQIRKIKENNEFPSFSGL